jgi:hypothetical protein
MGYNLKQVVLKWKRTTLSSMNEMEDTWFYSFTRWDNLLYIGMTFGKTQTVQKEIRQTLRSFDEEVRGLVIWLGYIDFEKTDYNQMKKKLIQDVEALLIRSHEPSWNTSNTKNYGKRRRRKLIVRNRGHPYLDKIVRVEGDMMYDYL